MGINIQQWLDTELDRETAEAVSAALAADAIEDAAVLKAKDDAISARDAEIARLKARIAELEAGQPEPEPEEPEVPASTFPDASSTGPKSGTVFVKRTGTLSPKSGEVLENIDLTGDIFLSNVQNVTIRNSRISSKSFQGINFNGNCSGLKVINCDLNGNAAYKGSYAITCPSDALIQGCNIYGWENAMMAGSRNVIKGNYIHNLLVNGADPHYDGIAVQGGQDDVLIEGNTIISWDTSGVFIKADFGNINNIRVLRNQIKCQAGKKYSAAVYVYGKPNGYARNVQIKDNMCEAGAYRYTFSIEGDTQGLVVSGNTDLNGKAITY